MTNPINLEWDLPDPTPPGEDQTDFTDARKPEIVYHYTDTGGIQGIISSSALWVSDVEFLNDAEELVYARSHLLHILQREANDVGLRSHEMAGNLRGHEREVQELRYRETVRYTMDFHMKVDDETGVGEALEIIIDELEQDNPSRSLPLHVYVACFCENGDLLSQWRGYGGTGGYAIGFRSDALETLSKAFPMGQFDRVCYGFNGTVRRGWIPKYLHSGLTFNDYLKALTMVKNPAFTEEQEWRLAIPERGFPNDVRFRTGSVGVIPYRQVNFPRDAVAKVIVGPGQNPTERIKGIRQLLDYNGMVNVSVEPSTTSLRL
ncbi:DUF2971 domain-containing protein [Streptomyces nojiriensis]|uniref:DUF2971 domain-containing protein n=1 Tax=Streptomyces nojiriensis TaxID=66374 RepID=UPI0036673A0B